MTRFRNTLIVSLPFRWLKVHLNFHGYYNIKHYKNYPSNAHIFIIYKGYKQNKHEIKISSIQQISYCIDPQDDFTFLKQSLPELPYGETYFLSVASCPKRIIKKITKQLNTKRLKKRSYKIVGHIPLYLKSKYTSQE
ncbi:hypothetical protein N9251_02840 [Gammaproteobacteria bacterium]|nr:hypothetical protein [Gammaproteobacteria bacterium]